MNPVELIRKKRNGHSLSVEELTYFFQGAQSGSVRDYQTSAMLMAIYFSGMNEEEKRTLTKLMLNSGVQFNFDASKSTSRRFRAFVDKHSTGGIGDKTSIILAPWMAACGLAVPMVAGRGLGFTGGTVDKLEAIPGFNTQPSMKAFKNLIETSGVGIMGQTDEFTPLDKLLYGLRDVTGTVESVPLITASILSKKCAEGIEALVLDIKFGSGAFMKTLKDAKILGQSLVSVGESLGVRTTAVLSRMEEPLGQAVGNSLEILESIECLLSPSNPGIRQKIWGKYIDRTLVEATKPLTHDLMNLTHRLAEEMLALVPIPKKDANKLLTETLFSGKAHEYFITMLQQQGVEKAAIQQLHNLAVAPKISILKSPKAGFISSMKAEEIGNCLIALGGGRQAAHEKINPGVGFYFLAKIGSKVKKGDPLIYVFHERQTDPAPVLERLEKALHITSQQPRPQKLVVGTIRAKASTKPSTKVRRR